MTPEQLAEMTGAEFAEYGKKILHALPFADNDAGLTETAAFIREQGRRLFAAAQRAERAEAAMELLVAECARHREDRRENNVPGMSIEMMAVNADRVAGPMVEAATAALSPAPAAEKRSPGPKLIEGLTGLRDRIVDNVIGNTDAGGAA